MGRRAGRGKMACAGATPNHTIEMSLPSNIKLLFISTSCSVKAEMTNLNCAVLGMVYPVVRRTTLQARSVFCSPGAAHEILRKLRPNRESHELLDEQREEIRVLFFCCDRCANDHIAWLRLKRGIQLLGEQL